MGWRGCPTFRVQFIFSDRHFVIKRTSYSGLTRVSFCFWGMGRYSGQARVWRRWGSCVRVRIADCLNDKLFTPHPNLPPLGRGKEQLADGIKVSEAQKMISYCFQTGFPGARAVRPHLLIEQTGKCTIKVFQPLMQACPAWVWYNRPCCRLFF